MVCQQAAQPIRLLVAKRSRAVGEAATELPLFFGKGFDGKQCTRRVAVVVEGLNRMGIDQKLRLPAKQPIERIGMFDSCRFKVPGPGLPAGAFACQVPLHAASPEIREINAVAGMIVRPPTRTALSGQAGSASILKMVDLLRLVAATASLIE
jgi:hypothetical protein